MCGKARAWYSGFMMKRQIVSGFFIASAAYAGLFPAPLEAATLPPGNPFYFMQDGMRALRRTFTFSPASRATLELRLVNERQADIREVLTAGKEESVIRAAFAAYGGEMGALESAMADIADERIVTGAAQVALAHMRFFNEAGAMKWVQGDDVAREAIAGAKRAVAQFASKSFGGDLHAAMFRRYISLVIGRESDAEMLALQTDAIMAIELGAADLVAEQSGNSVFVRAVRLAKDEALTALVGAVKGGALPIERLASSTGDLAIRAYVIEGARARVGDMETKASLGFITQRSTEELSARRLAGAGMAKEAIARASAAAAAIPAREAEGPKHFIEQAESFLMDNAYDLAFQNAVAAYSAASDAALAGAVTPAELREEISFVKRQYDRAGNEKPLFMEKRIGQVADMVSRAKGRDVLEAIREARLILFLLHNQS